jgi:hypothetical protein
MSGNLNGIYNTEELLLFRRIFEGALAGLPAAGRTADSRAGIARNLLACAATGERDPVELRLAALSGKARAGLSGPPAQDRPGQGLQG